MMTKKIRSSETIPQNVRRACQCPDIQPSCFGYRSFGSSHLADSDNFEEGGLRPIKMNLINTVLCYVYPNHFRKNCKIKHDRAEAGGRSFVHWAYQS
jgi:hypothetical protein